MALLIDSTSVSRAIAKGPSFFKRLIHSYMRIAAALITDDISLELYWMPSELNPADGPSVLPEHASNLCLPAHLLLRQKAFSFDFLRKADKSHKAFAEFHKESIRFARWSERKCPSAWTIVQLDESLCRYVCGLYRTNSRRGQRQKFLYALYGIEFFLLETAGALKNARQSASGKTQRIPVSSPLPLPRGIAHALSYYFWLKGDRKTALALSLGFHCYLSARNFATCAFGTFAISLTLNSRAFLLQLSVAA